MKVCPPHYLLLSMAAMKKTLIAVFVAAVAAFLGHRILWLKRASLADREVTSVKHLKCRYLENIEYGSEDIVILKDGLAFFSSGLKFPPLPSFSDDPGRLYVIDLLHPKPTPVELQISGELDLTTFTPHGVSAYVDEADDSVYLFVVNHPQLPSVPTPQKSQVEIFRFVQDNTLEHLKTITHPLLHNVNDIVAVGPESFYASKDQGFSSKQMHILTVYLGLPTSEVVYYSPQEVRVAATGFMTANGINISPDKRHIYVVDIVDHEVDVFERQEGEQLVYLKSVHVGSLCDNVDVDHKTGDLWLGCHPNSLKLSQFDPNSPPGSEVIKIKDILSEQPVVTQEYLDDGRVIMASTIAAAYEGKLFIGTAFHKALYCDLN